VRRRWLAAVAVLAIAVAVPAESAPLDGRAYTVVADAYPVEPAPGAQRTSLGARPTATKSQVSNPPAAAYAKAAATDFGLAEAYFGAQGPRAEADTETGNAGTKEVREGGMLLVATAQPSPLAEAAASGNATGDGPLGVGSSSSATVADGTGGALVATTEAEVNNVAMGALAIGSARFTGHVSIDGTPSGATAAGRVVVNDATVADVPVVIGADGVTVDDSKVPVEQLALAADVVRQALTHGGYSEVRVVQPTTEVSKDGTRAYVGGGGVFLHFNSNDPSNRYFLKVTLVGGSATATLGSEIGTVAASPPAAAPAVAPAAGPASPSSGPAAAPAAPRPSPPAATGSDEAEAVSDFDRAAGAATIALARPWDGWPWLLLAAAVLAALTFTFRRRLAAVADAAADRYLRG